MSKWEDAFEECYQRTVEGISIEQRDTKFIVDLKSVLKAYWRESRRQTVKEMNEYVTMNCTPTVNVGLLD